MVFILKILYNNNQIIAIIWSDIMKKINKMGFFFVETMVVIAVIGIVLTYLFKTFSDLYTRFSISEYYNTVEAVNAAGNIKQYIDKMEIAYEDMILL
jgi:Tfp pilus assembly protein PilE